MPTEGVKLTKAQRVFLEQLDFDHERRAMNPGFDFDVLRGSEMAMARRLAAAGLVFEDFKPIRGPFWNITDLGRAALNPEGKP